MAAEPANPPSGMRGGLPARANALTVQYRCNKR